LANRPLVGLKKIKIGSQNYTIPIPLNTNQSIKKSIRNVLVDIGLKKKKNFIETLVYEMLDFKSMKYMGSKIDTHKLALKNRKFLHYRWF